MTLEDGWLLLVPTHLYEILKPDLLNPPYKNGSLDASQIENKYICATQNQLRDLITINHWRKLSEFDCQGINYD